VPEKPADALKVSDYIAALRGFPSRVYLVDPEKSDATNLIVAPVTGQSSCQWRPVPAAAVEWARNVGTSICCGRLYPTAEICFKTGFEAIAQLLQPLATRRKCTGVFTNTWGNPISNVGLWYRRGRSDQQHWSWPSLAVGQGSGGFEIRYETGVGSDLAYWYCEFTDAGGTRWRVNKDNFFCNIESEDEGKVVGFSVLPESKEFKVLLSDGDSCAQGLTT
jgi:hypothetical protein